MEITTELSKNASGAWNSLIWSTFEKKGKTKKNGKILPKGIKEETIDTICIYGKEQINEQIWKKQ